MTGVLEIVLRVSVPTFLVGSMLGMGLGLAPRALLAPLRDARLVALALAANFVLAPAFAWLLVAVLPLQAAHATGLLLLSTAAGAPFLPKLVENARGDLAFSVALMTLLTVGTTLFMPWALPLLAPGLEADAWGIARPLLVMILLPLLAGMCVRSRAPRWAERGPPVLAKIANASAVLVLIVVIVRDYRAVLGVVGSGAIAAAALFLAGLFALGSLLGGPRAPVRGVLGLGTAARNVGAAFVPASRQPEVMTMVVVSLLVMLPLLLLAGAWLRRRATVRDRCPASSSRRA
jgi:BASS family bile acid:Na+ symporter